MNLVEYLQSLASVTLSTIATIFEFLGGLPFFVLLFAIFYLIYSKKFAYNYFLTYAGGFIFGSLFLKNVVGRLRPYAVNSSLKAETFAYSGSLPSAKSILSATNSSYIYASVHKKTNKVGKIFLIIGLTLVSVLVGFSQIYFANNYLLDVILGLIIGLGLSILFLTLINKIKINKKYMLIFALPLLVILLFVYVLQWFTNNFANSAVLEFIGISMSIIIGTFLEEKFIKFNETKNNLFYTSFKLLITLIILMAYYFLCSLLPGILIFSFLKYFVAGFIVTLILPLCFKKLEKFFYVFSPTVSQENLVMSSISTGVRGTKRLAKKIYSKLNTGDVVLLSGDLGAGKSELVRGILVYSGVKKEITSPTFTLVNEYVTPKDHFYHFDMYRIEDEQEVINIGFSELIDSKDAIKFVEWPEKVQTFLPSSYKKITIVKLGKKLRNIILEDYSLNTFTSTNLIGNSKETSKENAKTNEVKNNNAINKTNVANNIKPNNITTTNTVSNINTTKTVNLNGAKDNNNQISPNNLNVSNTSRKINITMQNNKNNKNA